MDKNNNQINDIIEMLDEFANSRDKRVKISTSDELKEGEKKKSCYLSKYDKTDPSVKDIASIPNSSGLREPKSINLESFSGIDFMNLNIEK